MRVPITPWLLEGELDHGWKAPSTILALSGCAVNGNDTLLKSHNFKGH